MSDASTGTTIRSTSKKSVSRQKELEQIEGAAFMIFDEHTLAFIHVHSPGQLTYNLYKIILAVMEHQLTRQQPEYMMDFLYDVKQLLQLLEEADRLLQLEIDNRNASETNVVELNNFLSKARDFMYDHDPARLSHYLCRLLLDYLRYELADGYPTYINQFLPHAMALFQWLDEGITLLKREPPKASVSE